MKVLNLQCAQRHGFEGWFASEDDFQSQRTHQLVACPICGDSSVSKLPSAPRLNLRGADADTPAAPAPASTAPAGPALEAAWLSAMRQVVASTEDVGARFAEEARKIHYGECEARGIRGQASREETEALLDEGIAVLPLAIPAGLEEPLQ